MKRWLRQLSVVSMASMSSLLLSGCMLGPDYVRPTVDLPNGYRSASGFVTDNTSIADMSWWELYKDPVLEGLVRSALKNNYSVKVALSRIEQSRAYEMQVRSQLFPSVSYQGAVSRGANEMFGTPSPAMGKIGEAGMIGLNAIWELDIWGRVRRADEAAKADLYASEQVYRGAMLSLVSDIAKAYFQLLELDVELQIAKNSVDAFQKTLDIFNDQLQGGIASRLETSRAEAALANAASHIPEIERQIIAKENQISLLLGMNPGPIQRQASTFLQKNPPRIPAGVPADILARRPDVLQAEAQMQAANAMVGVSVAEFFPRIGLSSLFGSISTDLSDLTSGKSKSWSIAANASGPIFEGGRLYGQYEQSKAFWDQTVTEYDQTILNALQEVSNAMVACEKLEGVRGQQARAVKALQEAVDVSFDRYINGKAAYYEVLDTQQQLFPAQTLLAQTDMNRQLALIQLYAALGGGWQLNNQEFAEGQVQSKP